VSTLELENAGGSCVPAVGSAALHNRAGIPGIQTNVGQPLERFFMRSENFGELSPIGRPGGQGRVYRPSHVPTAFAGASLVVKLYRRPPPAGAVHAFVGMIAWSQSLAPDQRARLAHVAAWPLAILTAGRTPVGIVMHDVSGRFEVPFVMPSGRREQVLLSLEHLLGGDQYLQLRRLDVRLDTTTRTQVAADISRALAFLHRHGIVASDIAPNNLLVAFTADHPSVCFIDCDSMVFHGRQALAAVETGDWQMPAGFSEPPRTRAADAYKLGLVILRLYARCHDARLAAPHTRHLPAELRDLVARALGPAAANRPPAGEWQRALRELLVRGGLNERYPGPAPAPIRARPVVASERRHEASPPQPTPAPAVRASRSSSPPRTTQQPVRLAWLVIAVVLLALILSRLVAAATPPQGDGGFGPGASGTGAGNGSYQYYYEPQGPGSAIP